MSLKNDSTTTFIGEHIGSYRITARLTAGGFGVVYLGEHIILKRQVAVKVLHDKHVFSERERSQFLQEAYILENVRHPYVLSVIDVAPSPFSHNGSNRDDSLPDRHGPCPYSRCGRCTLRR